MAMPGGRPSMLDQVVRHRRDGTPVTAGQEVIERITLGLDYGPAADSAGVSRQTLHKWRLAGSRARIKALKPGARLTKKEQVAREFVDALETAEADRELNRLAVIQRAAEPHTFTRETVKVLIEYDDKGNPTERVVERSTVTEHRSGQWQAAAWFLERTMQAKYLRRLELTGPQGGPIEVADRARGLAEALRDFQAGADAAAEVHANGNGTKAKP